MPAPGFSMATTGRSAGLRLSPCRDRFPAAASWRRHQAGRPERTLASGLAFRWSRKVWITRCRKPLEAIPACSAPPVSRHAPGSARAQTQEGGSPRREDCARIDCKNLLADAWTYCLSVPLELHARTCGSGPPATGCHSLAPRGKRLRILSYLILFSSNRRDLAASDTNSLICLRRIRLWSPA